MIATAAAAPAYAVSCDQAPATPVTMSRVGTSNQGAQVGAGGGVTVTAATVIVGPNTSRDSNNLRTDWTAQNMSGWLTFANRPRGNGGQVGMAPGHYQEITLTFSQSVQDLKFDIADIDTSGYTWFGQQRYNYWDAVAITSPTNGAVTGMGTALTGAGTLTNPWRQQTFSNDATPNQAASNRLTATFPGPLSTVTIRYWSIRSENDYDGAQGVWVGNMSYKANCT